MIQLQIVGGTGLTECQGNCINNDDCGSGLTCWYRNTGDPPPPGCVGRPYQDYNYCVPFRSPLLEDVEALTPLVDRGGGNTEVINECEGDCDSSAHCSVGLTCFNRDVESDPYPPRCKGDVVYHTHDWCVQVDPIKLGLCEGDCYTDDDCVGNLVCSRRNVGDPAPTVCSGSAYQDWGYCIGQTTDKGLNPTALLGHCEGNCDSDSDCSTGLKCVHFGADPSVPYCLDASPVSDHDYCVDLDSFTIHDNKRFHTNIALRGSASQSSTVTEFSAVASLAIDGNTDGIFFNGSVSHTHGSDNAWWEVQLDKEYMISTVAVFNRIDTCDTCLDRINGFTMTISLEGVEKFKYIDTTSRAAAVTTIPITGGALGDKVRIEVDSPHGITLAEVEVYGGDFSIDGIGSHLVNELTYDEASFDYAIRSNSAISTGSDCNLSFARQQRESIVFDATVYIQFFFHHGITSEKSSKLGLMVRDDLTSSSSFVSVFTGGPNAVNANFRSTSTENFSENIYNYAKGHVLVSLNTKCPVERLFKTDASVTLDECAQLCQNTASCKYYIHGDTNAPTPGTCMGCTESVTLVTHNGFHAFVTNFHSTSPDSVYNLGHPLVSLNTKCPAERLFKIYESMTLVECARLCQSTFECNYYVYGDANSQNPGSCMGCTESVTLASHTGFHAFEMKIKAGGWFRIRRHLNLFYTYHRNTSTDPWLLLDSTDTTMSDDVEVGVFASANSVDSSFPFKDFSFSAPTMIHFVKNGIQTEDFSNFSDSIDRPTEMDEDGYYLAINGDHFSASVADDWSISIPLGTGDFILEMKLKVKGFAMHELLSIFGGRVYFDHYDGSFAYQAGVFGSVATDFGDLSTSSAKLFFFRIERSGTNVQFYVNNVEVGNSAITTATEASSIALRPWRGQIRVYDFSITSESLSGFQSQTSALLSLSLIGTTSGDLNYDHINDSYSVTADAGTDIVGSSDSFTFARRQIGPIRAKRWRLLGTAKNKNTLDEDVWDVSQLRMHDEDNEEVQPSAVISSRLHSDGSPYHQDNVLVSSGRWGGRADSNGDLYIGFEFSGIVAVTKAEFKHYNLVWIVTTVKLQAFVGDRWITVRHVHEPTLGQYAANEWIPVSVAKENEELFLDVSVYTQNGFDSSTTAHGFSKIALMMRDTTSPGSKFFSIMQTKSFGVVIQWREETGGNYQWISGVSNTGGGWLRITREHHVFKCYFRKTDADTWNYVGSRNIIMSGNVEVGVGVSSNQSSVAQTIVFSDFMVKIFITPIPSVHTNVALLGTAQQSSTYSNNQANLVNDGSIFNFQTTDVDQSELAWLQIELDDYYMISSVIAYISTHCCLRRNNYFRLVIFHDNDPVFYYNDSATSVNLVTNIPVSPAVKGNIVRFELVSLDYQNIIQLKELEVYAGQWVLELVGSQSSLDNFSVVNDVYTLSGTSGDLGGTKDSFLFARSQTGELFFDMRMYVPTGFGLNPTGDPWSKLALLLKESTDPGAKIVAAVQSAQNGLGIQWRDESDTGIKHSFNSDNSGGLWLRVTREYDLFRVYNRKTSVDSWEILGSKVVGMTKYFKGEPGTNFCPTGSKKVTSIQECFSHELNSSPGFQVNSTTLVTANKFPSGCYSSTLFDGVQFNTLDNSQIDLEAMWPNPQPICKRSLEIGIGLSTHDDIQQSVDFRDFSIQRFNPSIPSIHSNVALSGYATQSSESSNYPSAASLAIDGNTDGVFGNGSVSTTNDEMDAWWQVRLDKQYMISSVVLYNRVDSCCLDRLNGFKLTIYNNGKEVFSYIDNAALASAVTRVPIVPNIAGTVVKIQIPADLSVWIAECEVYAGTFSHDAIGSDVLVSDLTSASDSFSMTSASGDIWGASDSFVYFRQEWGYSDFDFFVNTDSGFDSNLNSDPSAKFGISIRDTIEPGSKHISILQSQDNDLAIYWRDSKGAVASGTTVSTNSGGGQLRMIRQQNTFTAYFRKSNIETWQFMSSKTFDMNSSHFYFAGSGSKDSCPDGSSKVTYEECTSIDILSSSYFQTYTCSPTTSRNDSPSGCYTNLSSAGHICFNEYNGTLITIPDDMAPVCKGSSLQVGVALASRNLNLQQTVAYNDVSISEYVASEVPSSLPSSSPSVTPSNVPTAVALLFQGIHLSGHADKCLDYNESGVAVLVTCDTSSQKQDFRFHEDGRITTVAGSYADQCMSRVSDDDRSVHFVPCGENPYMLWTFVGGVFATRVGSWCLDSSDSLTVVLNPCLNNGIDQVWFDDSEQFPSSLPSSQPTSTPSILQSDSPSVTPSIILSDTPSVLLSSSPTQTAKPSFSPSSLPSSSPSSSPSDSSIPSLSPSVNVPIVRGIHMTGHADKCIEYFDNGEILLVSCNGNMQQDFKIHEDGRITASGGTYMNQCLSRSTNVNGYVALAPCENTPYMLWDHDDNRYVLRIDSLCLDIDDNFRLLVSPCKNDGTDQFWFDDTEMFPSNIPTTVPSSIPTILPSSQPTVSISPTLSESVSVEFTMELSGVSTLTADLELDIKILIIQSMKPLVITQNDIILTLVSSTSRRMLQNSNSSRCEVKVEITNSKVSSAKTRNNAENGLRLGLYKQHGIAVEVLIEDTNYPSDVPSFEPSALPSDIHSGVPSSSPSFRPSLRPSSKPTMIPSDSPSMNPSNLPSSKPSTTPSDSPSILPSSSPSRLPSFAPSLMPSYKPSRLPSREPTKQPSSVPSVSPSNLPTSNPSSEPSVYPSSLPSLAFSISPSVLHSDGPSLSASSLPSALPSLSPSNQPSLIPSSIPSALPSLSPSDQPSLIPSSIPSALPSLSPSDQPSLIPSSIPSALPSLSPSDQPSLIPSSIPSALPSLSPSDQPSLIPSSIPSALPSLSPSDQPSLIPSSIPSALPLLSPSNQPSSIPSSIPSSVPSLAFSLTPSILHSDGPSSTPTDAPSLSPSNDPSSFPSSTPSYSPSLMPSENPSSSPSSKPTNDPSSSTSKLPSSSPSIEPSLTPTLTGSSLPSYSPSTEPSTEKLLSPSFKPSSSPSLLESITPSVVLSSHPSSRPSTSPTKVLSIAPSGRPVPEPSLRPTNIPSASPSKFPSKSPSRRPTQIPSPSPSFSQKPTSTPTNSPTFSEFNSNAPSTSSVPSEIPTKTPSSSPSSFPTMYKSLYEGESCRANLECVYGICEENVCISESFDLSYRKDFVSETQISIEETRKWPKAIEKSGGVLFSPKDSIQMFGNVRAQFHLNFEIPMNFFTRIQFLVKEIQRADGIGICVYEDYLVPFEDLNIYCVQLRGGNLEIRNRNVLLEDRHESLSGEQRNLAMKKSADASTVIAPGWPELAVDGKDDQMLDNVGWESNSVTQTDVEDDPWWEVDLEEDFVIKKLIIFRRLGEYGDDLSNLEVVIRNSSNREVSKQVIDRNDETFLSIEINLDNVTGQKVRLNLKGKNRVLCLAEVKVYGEYYDFDLPIGEIFRFADMEMNRIALLQDFGNTDTVASIVEDIIFVEGNEIENDLDEEETSQWEQIHDISINNLNVQGTMRKSSSTNGKFIAVKNDANEILILREDKQSRKGETYHDKQGQVRSFAISDKGIAVVGFASYGVGVVKVFDVMDMTKGALHTQPWISQYGNGVDITPDSRMVAIGSPHENAAYTYNLERGQLTSERKILNKTFDSFGWKVALSENGSSLAVSAPLTLNRADDEVGTILIYQYIEGEWEMMNDVIYGNGQKRKLGLGGLAINEKFGRVDVIDQNEDVDHFLFVKECGDSFAEPVGVNENMFNARCECFSGYKSTNILGGNVLRESTDRCVPCVDGSCGTRPTASPTASPTLSNNPTIADTISMSPSQRPTTSMKPSTTPTTLFPSPSPSFSSKPSQLPSEEPSNFQSVKDGESCTRNNECQVNNCEEGRCLGAEQLSLEITNEASMKAKNIFALSPKNIESRTVETKFIYLDQYLNEHVYDGFSGIAIYGKYTMEIFGTTYRIFELSETIEINKNTRLVYSLDRVGASEVSTSICFFEDFETAKERIGCKEFDENSIQIEIGSTVNFRTTQVLFLAFHQNSHLANLDMTNFGKFTIVQGEPDSVVDSSGRCVDPFAETMYSEDGIKCLCRPGYVSSNGGRIQGESGFDKCVPCIRSIYCFFEGDKCEDDDECDQGSCSNSICGIHDVAINLHLNEESSETVMAMLKPDLSQPNDSIYKRGGVRVNGDNNLTLLGTLHKVYKFSEVIKSNRYTFIELNLETVMHPYSLEICIYEKMSEVIELVQIIDFEERCQNVPTSSGTVNISLGSRFNHRLANVRYMIFKQIDMAFNVLQSAEISISTIAIRYEEPTEYYEFYGSECSSFDSNSIQVNTRSGMRCSCIENYVSSNGGKIVGKNDVCIPNIDRKGQYDEISCSSFLECASGFCTDGICESAGDMTLAITDSTGSTEEIDAWRRPISGIEYSDDNGEILGPDGILKLFGDTESIYSLSRIVTVSKYTTLKIAVDRVGYDLSCEICILPSLDLNTIRSCPLLCMDLDPISGEELVQIKIRDVLRYRKLDVQYLLFRQKNLSTIRFGQHTLIKNIQFFQDEIDSLLDESGQCRDKNSKKVRRYDRSRSVISSDFCECFDGYLSSSGTKLRGEYDICLDCITSGGDGCSLQAVTDVKCSDNLEIGLMLATERIELSSSLAKVGNFVPPKRGGSIVKGDTILLHGTTKNSYRLSNAYFVSQFSSLRLNLVATKNLVGLCLSISVNFEEDGICFDFSIPGVTDRQWSRSLPDAKRSSLTLGQRCRSSSSRPGYECLFAVNGDLQSRFRSGLEENPWFEVQFVYKSLVQRIDVYTDGSKVDFTITILNEEELPAYQEKKVTDIGESVFTITTPLVFGTKVKITANGEYVDFQLKSIEIYGPSGSVPERSIEMPIGRFMEDEVIQYLTFIQDSDGTNISRIRNVEFEFGSIR